MPVAGAIAAPLSQPVASLVVSRPVAAVVAAPVSRVVTQGIYQFVSSSGKTYVGQSCNIPRRLAEHARRKFLAPGTPVMTTEVLGGKTVREIAEQLRINALGGIKNLANEVNPIGPNRQHLLP